MELKIEGDYLVVEKTDDSPKIKRQPLNAAGESQLLYHVKNLLNLLAGPDALFVKKRMWKDGHLVDEMQQYIKTARPRPGFPHIYLHNGHFAISGLDRDWHMDGRAWILITADVYNKQGKDESLRLLQEILDRQHDGTLI